MEIAPGRYVVWGDTIETLENGKRRELIGQPGEFFDGKHCKPMPVDPDSDGRRLAFSVLCSNGHQAHRGLYTLDLGTGRTTKISDQLVYGASWSPDDRQIVTMVTTKHPDGTFTHRLWIMEADGSKRHRIGPQGINHPTWTQ